MDADGGDEGLENKIISPELYDSARAKIDANLRWLFAKAYGEVHVPEDLRDPFYMDQYGVEHIKPPVLDLLLSAELYSRVCAFLSLGEQSTTCHTHHSVLQVLARQSIQVQEADGTPVTHHDLVSAPIRMSSHIPLIDALMLACTMEMMNVEQVVSCLKRFSTFSHNKELQRPFHMEEAMLFWINKVVSRTREICEQEFKLKQQLMDSPCHQKVRYRRDHPSSRILPHLPVVDDLIKDLCDGAALLTIIHYYCPEYMRLEDICLKEVLSLSDSVYNIQLLSEFSSEYLNRCFYLQTEDLLYAPPVLKHNVMVYIAELFWWFEVLKPDFVKPRDLQDIKEVRSLAQAKSSRTHMTVSNFPKRSFLSSSPSVDSLVTGTVNDNCSRYYRPQEESASVTKASTSYSLLSLKQRQQNPGYAEDTSEFRNRSSSLSRMDGHSPGPRLAWKSTLCPADRKTRPVSQLDMEWEHVGGDNISLARSISKDSLASNVISVTPRHRVNGQPSSDTAHSNDSEEKEEELVAIFGVMGAAGFKEPQPESFFLEPLQPAVLRPNKEKMSVVGKREESGEGQILRRRGGPSPTDHKIISQSFITVDTVEPENSGQAGGFFLHGNCKLPRHGKQELVSSGSETELEDEEEEDVIKEKQPKTSVMYQGEKRKCLGHQQEDESAKLCEDVRVCEHGYKDGTGGHCSPISQASSASSRMTSFAERRLHRTTVHDGYSSASSSHATTPDGSESGTLSPDVKEGLASELIHLRLQLEDKRRAIAAQKKKMEVLAARQRLQLGKAAFLNVVKKGNSDTLPHQAKQELVSRKEITKDDTCLEVLKPKSKKSEDNMYKESRKLSEGPGSNTATNDSKGINNLAEGVNEDEVGEDLDLSDCSHSIELLNDAIGAIQQQMMQLSLQQELLMKQTMKSPLQECIKTPKSPEHKTPTALQFLEMSTAGRRPPKLSSSRTTRSRPSELKLSTRSGTKVSSRTPTTDYRTPPEGRTPRAENNEDNVAKTTGCTPVRGVARNTTFRLHDSGNQRSEGPDLPRLESPAVEEQSGSGKETNVEQCEEKKAQLIEVALSNLTEAPESDEQKGLGFFFKDDQKAADELAKKRAAFLLKQQKKAEEARLRKQQLEAESELKRDEARRKAEEDRMRKEEEKARRELIKQEYLRRKQQELLEEQGVTKPRTHRRRPRPRSLHRGQSGTSTPVSLCAAPSGSSLSLASAVTETDSVTSGGGSQRGGGESVESFPMLIRNASRNMERDWDNGSTASSITSTAEYSGLKLFKEPSAKSNKLIIQNAIAHCCLAGKVNEALKNAVLEEIERCESNHMMILFRDGGCQFRALYAFMPDTEELTKISGTGPRAITQKMIDTLYKYSSDRKQFTIIPAKTVSASVDAITIHNHLWQLKRHCSSKRK